MLFVMSTPVGNRLRAARERRNLKKGQLAAISGVTRQWLALVEEGKIADPGGIRLDKVASRLGVSSRYLLTGSDAPDEGEIDVALEPYRRFPPDFLRRGWRLLEALYSEEVDEGLKDEPKDERRTDTEENET